jgi:tetratricopeptide (TPR) repeat protein
MSFSTTVKKIISQVAYEAQSCGNSRVEPEHLLIAISRMVYDRSSNSNFGKDIAFLEHFFKAGDLRPADLAERLFREMKHKDQLNNDLPLEYSTRYNQILQEASVYADEENIQIVGLKHLLLPLLVNFETNPVFRSIIKELGGNLGRMKEEVGLHQSRIKTTGITSNDVTVTKQAPKDAERSAENTAGLNSRSQPRQPASVPVPNEAVRSKFVQADEAMRCEKWDDAVRLYEKGLEAYPAVSPAWNNLGMAYMRLRRFEEAKRSFESAVLFDSGNADAYANLGVLLGGYLGKSKEAEAYFTEALRINPNHSCRQYLENPQLLRAQAERAKNRRPRTVYLSKLLSSTASHHRSAPHSKHHDMTVGPNRSDSFSSRSSSVAEPRPSVLRAGPSLKQLQQAANYELFPKALTRYVLVCALFGSIDVTVGIGFYKMSWLYSLLAAFGVLLALEGILSKILHRPRGFLEEGFILFVLGITCVILLFSTAYQGHSSGEGMTWGRMVLFAFLGPLQIKAASDCFGRYRIFEEFSTRPPLPQTSQCLNEIREEIIKADAGSDAEIIEFVSRMGRWKGRLGPEVGTFVNIDLGDVLFVAKSMAGFKQPLPNVPAVWLQMGKSQISARMVEPSLSRMKRWFPSVRE